MYLRRLLGANAAARRMHARPEYGAGEHDERRHDNLAVACGGDVAVADAGHRVHGEIQRRKVLVHDTALVKVLVHLLLARQRESLCRSVTILFSDSGYTCSR